MSSAIGLYDPAEANCGIDFDSNALSPHAAGVEPAHAPAQGAGAAAVVVVRELALPVERRCARGLRAPAAARHGGAPPLGAWRPR
jgi:hypothetical protein